MKKKLIGIFVLVMSVLFLVACGKESMDGTYYEYYDVKGQTTIFKDYPVKVSGDTLVGQFNGDTYEINFENKILVREGEILNFSYSDDILKFEDNTFVKVDSDSYNKMIDDGIPVK